MKIHGQRLRDGSVTVVEASGAIIAASHPLLMMHCGFDTCYIPREHWEQIEEDEGRFIRKVCYSVDLLPFFANGSLIFIGHFADGGKFMPKERCEILGGNRSAVIDNFTKLELYDKSKKRAKKFSGKGHAEKMVAFVSALITREPAISMDSPIATTLVSFAVLESIETGKELLIDTEKI